LLNQERFEVAVDWKAIQEKVLREWEQARIFEADPDPSKKKFFITVAYPYPNSPQHIGHARTYTITDVHARYLRMRGYNVLFPMAFHYTGTPILAMAERIAKGDSELVDDFLRIYHVPKEKLKDFAEPIEIARYFLRFTQNQSCGKCTHCRIGTKRMLEILNRLCEGKAEKGIGKAKTARLLASIELGKRLLSCHPEARAVVRSPQDIANLALFLASDASSNMESISRISPNKSCGIWGASFSTLAFGISVANRPPARFRAKFFSSKMPVKPIRAVGGATCLDSRSRISVILRLRNCCK
jgi:hypothetical protein